MVDAIDTTPFTNESIKRCEDNAKARYQEMIPGIPKASKKEVARLEERAEPKDVKDEAFTEVLQKTERQIFAERKEKADAVLALSPADRKIDDIIMYLGNVYFPSSPDGREAARPATIAPRVDFQFLQAQEQVQEGHPDVMESSIRYLCYKNGWDMFRALYKNEIEHCTNLYKGKSRSADVELYGTIRSKGKIKQSDGRTQVETGFTPADKELIQKLAKVLGLSDGSLLIVFFWLAVINSEHIEPHLVDYGKGIHESFKLHLNQRIHQLGFSRSQPNSQQPNSQQPNTTTPNSQHPVGNSTI
jgi:hypothetical protein